MMSQSVQHGCVQDIASVDKRHAERTKRFEGGRLSRRWSQRMNLDETFRVPSHFTWRF